MFGAAAHMCLHLLFCSTDRQAEWNTLVLQREQAALKALQESQVHAALQLAAATAVVDSHCMAAAPCDCWLH
jgi:hypothetical protein